MYFYIVLFKNILKIIYILSHNVNYSEEIHVYWNSENSSETCIKSNVENNVKKRKNNNILCLCLCI